MSDGLFDLTEPEWSDIPVTEIPPSLYRSRIVALRSGEVRFTGTSRHTGDAGPYVVVYGIDEHGRNHQQVFTPLDTVPVKAKERSA